MKCLYCSKDVEFEPEQEFSFIDNATKRKGIKLACGFCPRCGNFIVILQRGDYEDLEDSEVSAFPVEVIYPRFIERNLPKEVPEAYRSDFEEAASILLLSPKASAAISRRLLQQTFREQFHIRANDLSKEIDCFLEKKIYPVILHKPLMLLETLVILLLILKKTKLLEQSSM